MPERSSNPGKTNLSNWQTAPHNRWAFHHVDKIIATAPVENDEVIPAPLSKASGLANSWLLKFGLNAIGTDAMVVLHNGKLLFEWYARGNDTHTPHILMSSTKAIMGLLAGILHSRGEFDTEASVSTYVPEISKTPYQGATIRNLLDMRTSIHLDEAQQRAYDVSTNWQPLEPGRESAGLASFFEELTGPQHAHGGPFRYASANTDLLGWAMERATGQTVASLLSARLWRPMGAEGKAYMTVDLQGLARSAGGLCATARDLARIGQLIVDDGRSGEKQVIPESVIHDIAEGGDSNAWRTGEWGKSFAQISSNMRYRSGWYVVDDPPKTMFAMGIYGQNLFVDRANRIVVAKFSSWKKSIDYVSLWATHKGYQALQRSLTRKPR